MENITVQGCRRDLMNVLYTEWSETLEKLVLPENPLATDNQQLVSTEIPFYASDSCWHPPIVVCCPRDSRSTLPNLANFPYIPERHALYTNVVAHETQCPY